VVPEEEEEEAALRCRRLCREVGGRGAVSVRVGR
jgi:hypothetical protein